MATTTTNAHYRAPSATHAPGGKQHPQPPVTKNDLLGATLSLTFSTAVTRAVQAFERERSGAGAGALAWVRWGAGVQRSAAEYDEDGVESELGEEQPDALDEKCSHEAWLAGLAVDDRIVRLPGDGVFIKPHQTAFELDVDEVGPESAPHSAASSPVSISYPPSPAPEQQLEAAQDEWEHVEAEREEKAASANWSARSLPRMPRRVPRTLRRLSGLGSTDSSR